MKLSNKSVLSIIFIFLMLAIFVSNVYAITGSIGNARMVLRLNLGDQIEKSILVKNINDVPVNVELTVFGDLEDYINIKDKSFTLQPKEEKKAFFTIDVKKGGSTETKINVKFSPIDGGSGVGLTSTILVITEEKSDWNIFDVFKEDSEELDDNNVSVGLGGKKSEVKEEKESSKLMIISLISSIVLFIVLLVLLFSASKHIKNKRIIKTKKSFNNE